ncbi:MAG: acetyl-CoA C-acyltransferase [Acidobacteria bacterium]|nr:acetyl-CoA C-acyltransferase [Acidobacteriota bacterium]MCI0625944.1 acetyl-CoA C-acyltransferase [Acidobacteriota bacterium]MCI0719841.1 acetyl-CoA C-acyltransferase [Acidobacteriota bacterium]
MRQAVIVSAVRTPVGKAKKGTLKDMRPDDLAAAVIVEAVKRTPGLNPEEIDDVILGCAMPEAEQGMNVARIASLRAGLPPEVSAITINRFCSSGLQSIAFAAERIQCGSAEVVAAGGTESMSLIPMSGHKFSPNPYLTESYPDVYLGMGLTAENLARKYQVSREEQDGFSLRSHQKAVEALAKGNFKEETLPLDVPTDSLNGQGKKETRLVRFEQDEGPRAGTSMDALAKLKPAFHVQGTVTAGNSSQMSDGAAAAIVTSRDKASERGWTPLGRFVAYATAGVKPEEMGIGPAAAIPKALKLAGLKLEDIGLIELNEAFAAQALAVIKEARLDPSKVNVNGGAIALGHPLGCTGAKLTAALLNEMRRRQVQFGMVTMCVGGGMGAAGIFELAP